MDYLVFEFDRLTPAQRATYITRGVNNQYVHRLNKRESWYKLEDKPTFDRIFAKYLHRDWMLLTEGTAEDFAAFLGKHDRIVCKPVDATCGRGIVMYHREEISDPAQLYEQLKAGGQVLVEEYVVQHRSSPTFTTGRSIPSAW